MLQGVSRSASFVIAYLMWRDRLDYDTAFQRVREARTVCSPNPGFIFQVKGAPFLVFLLFFPLVSPCLLDFPGGYMLKFGTPAVHIVDMSLHGQTLLS